MRTADEIVDAARVELARWLVTDPRVFAGRVIIITDTDPGGAIRLFSETLEQSIDFWPRRAPGVKAESIAERMTADASPIVIVTRDGLVWLQTFEWARARATVRDAP